MYRKFVITDEAGDITEFSIFPDLASPNNNLIKYGKYNINMTLGNKEYLTAMIRAVNAFMGGNTICKLEVEEKEEV